MTNKQNEDNLYKLSPSDFAYLWEDCKHCYYQKVKLGVMHFGIFPSMFTKINSLLQNSIMNKNLKDIHNSLPDGIIKVQEGFLKSVVIDGTNCYLSGRFDILVTLEDGTYALIDFKIVTPNNEKIIEKYASQLHAYKFALENPAKGKARKVSKMGVVSINPDKMHLENGKIVFTTTPDFHEIKEDMESFHKMVGEIDKVLSGELPSISESCSLCIYRSKFS